MITKVIGALCIICATSLYGYTMTRELTVRISTLKALRRAFMLLKSEIRYGMETLSEAFIHIGSRLGGSETSVKEFFETIGKRLAKDTQAELKTLWEEETAHLVKCTHLNGYEADRLAETGGCLGYLDITQQINNIDLYLEALDEDISALSEKYAGTCRMYTGLGIMAGVFLTIILV